MGSFALQLKAFQGKTERQLDDLVGLVVVKVAAKLDYRSPVGDASYWATKPPKGYVGGRFRANWQLGVGTIPGGQVEATDRSAKYPDRGGDTTSRIIAVIPEDAAGRVFYLSNNVPYAQRIEDGWSRQAPTGLVALTAMEFSSIVGESAAAVRQ